MKQAEIKKIIKLTAVLLVFCMLMPLLVACTDRVETPTEPATETPTENPTESTTNAPTESTTTEPTPTEPTTTEPTSTEPTPTQAPTEPTATESPTSEPAKELITVRWYDGNTLLKEEQIEKGKAVTDWSPEIDGKRFIGWYKDKTFATPFNAVAPLLTDTDLYAKFYVKSTDTPSEQPSDTPSEAPSETPSEQPSETPSETQSEQPSATPSEQPSENPTEAPTEPKPGENFEGVIISKVFGTGGKTDAAMSSSFIELYNPTSKTAVLTDTALYYGEGASFKKLSLAGVEIPAKSYFLIKCATVAGYDTSFEVLRIDEFDAEWGIDIDNKEFELVYTREDTPPTPGGDFENDSVFSYVVANEIEHVNVNIVHNLSKNRMIVRTDTSVEGYHKINLSTSGTAELQKVTPRTTKGNVNTYIASNFSEVLFSKEGGVYYSSRVKVDLTAPEGWTIYYTLNGDDPRIDGTVYSGTITISSTDSLSWGDTINLGISRDPLATPGTSTLFGGRVIKAYATNGTDSTAVYTQSYFASYTLSRLGVQVASFSVPREELLGEGGAYYDFPLYETRPRTRVYFEYFDGNGDRQGASYAEMAVSGVGSSGLPMKSLRVYLKDPLDLNDPAQDKIEFDIFDGHATNSLGQNITTFDRILFRNGGNDFGRTYLRDVFCQRMSEGLNVDNLAYEPILVFINGEFWGMYNCRERYSPEYFNRHYGVLEENVAIIENESPLKYDASLATSWDTDYVATTGDELVPHDVYAKEFNDLVAYIKANDLSDPVHYNYVADRLDIDSFIDYWVMNTYFCNPDWPGNNIKVWRNIDPNDPSGMDTKWRFVLLDMDSAVGAQVNSVSDWDKFNDIAENTRCGAIMAGLCENSDFCDRFYARAVYLVEDYFTYEKSIAVFEDMVDGIADIVSYQFSRYPNFGAYSNWQDELNVVRDFLADREEYYIQYLNDKFNK